jgi:pyruvate dehydrogenase E1 component beta subunit
MSKHRIKKNFMSERMLTVRKALNEAMAEEMRRDDAVFLIGEEVGEYKGAYKVSEGLLDEFGAQRVVDTPITEHAFTGLAVGAAFRGLKPIVEFMSFNFSMQAIDQIVNSAAKTLYMSGGQISCSIVFRGPNGIAARVAAQHSQCYASWYAHCPGLKVIAPYDAASAKGLLKAAIRDPNPVIFLENEMLYGRSFSVEDSSEIENFVLGKALIKRPGKDVTVVCFSFMVGVCLEAAKIAEQEGIDVCVIDLCTLRPWDKTAVIDSLRITHRLITVEEGWPTCGIGAEISAYVNEHAFDELDAPIERVAGAEVPMPYAKNLESLAVPSVTCIVQAIRRACYRDKTPYVAPL